MTTVEPGVNYLYAHHVVDTSPEARYTDLPFPSHHPSPPAQHSRPSNNEVRRITPIEVSLSLSCKGTLAGDLRYSRERTGNADEDDDQEVSPMSPTTPLVDDASMQDDVIAATEDFVNESITRRVPRTEQEWKALERDVNGVGIHKLPEPTNLLNGDPALAIAVVPLVPVAHDGASPHSVKGGQPHGHHNHNVAAKEKRRGPRAQVQSQPQLQIMGAGMVPSVHVVDSAIEHDVPTTNSPIQNAEANLGHPKHVIPAAGGAPVTGVTHSQQRSQQREERARLRKLQKMQEKQELIEKEKEQYLAQLEEHQQHMPQRNPEEYIQKIQTRIERQQQREIKKRLQLEERLRLAEEEAQKERILRAQRYEELNKEASEREARAKARKDKKAAMKAMQEEERVRQELAEEQQRAERLAQSRLKETERIQHQEARRLRQLEQRQAMEQKKAIEDHHRREIEARKRQIYIQSLEQMGIQPQSTSSDVAAAGGSPAPDLFDARPFLRPAQPPKDGRTPAPIVAPLIPGPNRAAPRVPSSARGSKPPLLVPKKRPRTLPSVNTARADV